MVVQSSAIYSTGIKESASCHCYGGRLQRLGLRVLIVSSVQVHRGNLRTQAATWPSTHGRAWMPRLHRGDRAGRARSAYPVGGSRSRGNEVVAVTVILKPDSAVRDAQSSRLRLRSVVGSKRTASPSRTEADPISKRRRVLQTSSSKVTATAMSVAARQSCDGMLTKRATKSLGCDRRQGSFSDVAEDLLMCDEVSPPSFINARKASDWSPALARNQEARCTQQQEGQTSYFAEHEDAVSCPEVPTAEVLAQAVRVFLDLSSSSRLFQLLMRVSTFCDGYCLAAIVELMRRGGCLSTLSLAAHFDQSLAAAFMLTLKMDEEALDRCIEKALWSLLASFVFFDHVPSCSSGRELETHFFAVNKQLDLKRALLRATELDFLRKIDWRCHVAKSDRILVLEQLLLSGDQGRFLAQRKRTILPRATIGGQCDEACVDPEEAILFLQDKNEEGERTWSLLSDILCLIFDTQLVLPQELKQANRQPARMKKVASFNRRSCARPAVNSHQHDAAKPEQHFMRPSSALPNLLDDTLSTLSPSAFLAHMASATPTQEEGQTTLLASSQYELALPSEIAYRRAPTSSTSPPFAPDTGSDRLPTQAL